nr:putative ribonuclease h protein [Quercus suber]
MVRQIQVCEEGAEDTLIWPLTNDGEYSVRSAYCMLISTEALLMPSSSVQANNGMVWKKIWKIQTPNKIRNFIWRAAKDSLPIEQNLRARQLPIS